MPKMPLFQAFLVAFLVYGQLQAWVAKPSCLIFLAIFRPDPLATRLLINKCVSDVDKNLIKILFERSDGFIAFRCDLHVDPSSKWL